MDLQDTLDAIDEAAVHHCGHCDTVLGPEAPSNLFCSEEHQEAFYAARSEAPVGAWALFQATLENAWASRHINPRGNR